MISWVWSSLDAKRHAKFRLKIMFYAVLNWKRTQFSESARFAWIWKKIMVYVLYLFIYFLILSKLFFQWFFCLPLTGIDPVSFINHDLRHCQLSYWGIWNWKGTGIEEYRGQISVILDYNKKSIVFPKSQCTSVVPKQERLELKRKLAHVLHTNTNSVGVSS